MALIIRLRKQGANNRQCFRLVVADERSPRDGKYVEKLGWYDPLAPEGKLFSIDAEKVEYWLSQGAQISERALLLVGKVDPAVVKRLTEKQVLQRTKKRLSRKKRQAK